MRWAIVLLLAGCSGLPYYSKPGDSSGDLQADVIACGTQGKRGPMDAEIACMRAKGWTYQ